MPTWTKQQLADYAARMYKNPPAPEVPFKTMDHPDSMSESERRLNKTEKRFLDELRRRKDRFRYVGIQEITLRLGFDTRYTPDFNCSDYGDRVSLFEVKGFMRDDARAKLYTAAAKFRCFTFWLVRWEKGEWIETLVKT